jgi:hypothetical protein
MDERLLIPKHSGKSTARLLRRIAAMAVVVPAFVAVLGIVAQSLLQSCIPQLYGVGECYVGSVNLAPLLVVATGAGLYCAAFSIVFLAAPLLAIAWWLERRDNAAA